VLDELFGECAVLIEHGEFLIGIVSQVERPRLPAVQGPMEATRFASNLQDDVRDEEAAGGWVLLNIEGPAVVIELDTRQASRLEVDEETAVALQEVGFVEEVSMSQSPSQ